MQIRLARPEDAMAAAWVHVLSWQAGYEGLLPRDYLNALRPEDRAGKYDFGTDDPLKPQTIVATERGFIQGFATVSAASAPALTGYGELCALYVHPDQWGRGIGMALLSSARARLSERGFQRAVLWVLAGNVRAERFYRADGWVADGLERTASVWGIDVREMRYSRKLETF